MIQHIGCFWRQHIIEIIRQKTDGHDNANKGHRSERYFTDFCVIRNEENGEEDAECIAHIVSIGALFYDLFVNGEGFRCQGLFVGGNDAAGLSCIGHIQHCYQKNGRNNTTESTRFRIVKHFVRVSAK